MFIYIPHATVAIEAQVRRENAAKRRQARALRTSHRQARSTSAEREPLRPRFPKLRVPPRYWLAA